MTSKDLPPMVQPYRLAPAGTIGPLRRIGLAGLILALGLGPVLRPGHAVDDPVAETTVVAPPIGRLAPSIAEAFRSFAAAPGDGFFAVSADGTAFAALICRPDEVCGDGKRDMVLERCRQEGRGRCAILAARNRITTHAPMPVRRDDAPAAAAVPDATAIRSGDAPQTVGTAAQAGLIPGTMIPGVLMPEPQIEPSDPPPPQPVPAADPPITVAARPGPTAAEAPPTPAGRRTAAPASPDIKPTPSVAAAIARFRRGDEPGFLALSSDGRFFGSATCSLDGLCAPSRLTVAAVRACLSRGGRRCELYAVRRPAEVIADRRRQGITDAPATVRTDLEDRPAETTQTDGAAAASGAVILDPARPAAGGGNTDAAADQEAAAGGTEAAAGPDTPAAGGSAVGATRSDPPPLDVEPTGSETAADRPAPPVLGAVAGSDLPAVPRSRPSRSHTAAADAGAAGPAAAGPVATRPTATRPIAAVRLRRRDLPRLPLAKPIPPVRVAIAPPVPAAPRSRPPVPVGGSRSGPATRPAALNDSSPPSGDPAQPLEDRPDGVPGRLVTTLPALPATARSRVRLAYDDFASQHRPGVFALAWDGSGFGRDLCAVHETCHQGRGLRALTNCLLDAGQLCNLFARKPAGVAAIDVAARKSPAIAATRPPAPEPADAGAPGRTRAETALADFIDSGIQGAFAAAADGRHFATVPCQPTGCDGSEMVVALNGCITAGGTGCRIRHRSLAPVIAATGPAPAPDGRAGSGPTVVATASEADDPAAPAPADALADDVRPGATLTRAVSDDAVAADGATQPQQVAATDGVSVAPRRSVPGETAGPAPAGERQPPSPPAVPLRKPAPPPGLAAAGGGGGNDGGDGAATDSDGAGSASDGAAVAAEPAAAAAGQVMSTDAEESGPKAAAIARESAAPAASVVAQQNDADPNPQDRPAATAAPARAPEPAAGEAADDPDAAAVNRDPTVVAEARRRLRDRPPPPLLARVDRRAVEARRAGNPIVSPNPIVAPIDPAAITDPPDGADARPAGAPTGLVAPLPNPTGTGPAGEPASPTDRRHREPAVAGDTDGGGGIGGAANDRRTETMPSGPTGSPMPAAAADTAAVRLPAVLAPNQRLVDFRWVGFATGLVALLDLDPGIEAVTGQLKLPLPGDSGACIGTIEPGSGSGGWRAGRWRLDCDGGLTAAGRYLTALDGPVTTGTGLDDAGRRLSFQVRQAARGRQAAPVIDGTPSDG